MASVWGNISTKNDSLRKFLRKIWSLWAANISFRLGLSVLVALDHSAKQHTIFHIQSIGLSYMYSLYIINWLHHPIICLVYTYLPIFISKVNIFKLQTTLWLSDQIWSIKDIINLEIVTRNDMNSKRSYYCCGMVLYCIVR